MKETMPADTGEITQLAAMFQIFDHWTASSPWATRAKPTIAPTMEWVVDTGQPRWDATSSQVPAASKAANMPKTNWSGSPANKSASTMPLRTVEVTSPPANTAPANSKMAATSIAPRTVRTLEPTDVAMALATSLAPMPQAMNNPNTAANKI